MCAKNWRLSNERRGLFGESGVLFAPRRHGVPMGFGEVKEKQEGETKKREPSQTNETIPEGKQGDDQPNGASVENR